MFVMEGVIVWIVVMSRIVVSVCTYVFNLTYLQHVYLYGMNTQMCIHSYV